MTDLNPGVEVPPPSNPLPPPLAPNLPVRDRRLIEGPLVRTLLIFALPLVGTNLMHSVAASYAAAWVGHVVGPNGLTAVVICNVLVWMMLMASVMGIGAASSILIAQAYGAMRDDLLKSITGASVTFVTVGSLVLALIGWWTTPLLVDLISTPAEARELAIAYLRANCLAVLTVFPLVFVTVMIRGVGDSRTPFIFTALWIGLSLFFCPALLVGAFGLPELGIAGVAYGNLVSSAISLVALIVHLHVTRHVLVLSRVDLHHLIPDPRQLGLLIKRGAPMGLEGILISGVYLALISMVNQYGAATSAAYGAGTQLWAFVQMPIGALSASVSAMASQNIGAGRWDRVNDLALKACLACAAITTFAVAIIYALGETLLGLFLPEGGAALATALRLNAIVLWSWIPLSVTMVLFGIVRANGAMIPPTLIMVGTLWMIRIPFAEGMQPLLGVDAIWWSFPVGTIMCAVLAFAYYRWGPWRTKSLLGEPV